MAVRKLAEGRHQGVYRDAAGRRHTKVFATKTAARTWADDGAAAVRAGTHRNPRAGRVLVGDWHQRWDAARVIEDSTRRVARSYSKVLLAQWGAWPLDAITRMEVQAWVRQLEVDGRGPSSIEKTVQMLTAVLQAAVDDGLLAANPARGVRIPKRPKSPDRILTFEEELQLLEQLPTEQDRRMVMVMLDTGLRYGELAGLHAHRIDLLRRELHVVEVLTQAGQIKTHPKSDRGRRTVPLEERSRLALAQQLEQWPDGLVFRTARGGRPMAEPNWVKRAWAPAVGGRPAVPGKSAAVPPLALPLPTPHDLRHTALSRLVAEGVDVRTVQDFAGHESIQTTMRYLHAAPDAGERARMGLRAVAAKRAALETSGADLAHEPQTGPA